MILIWRGWGILTLPIIVVTWLVIGGGLAVLARRMGLPQLEPVGAAIGCLAAAAAIWWAGKRLNGRPPRELIDARTGERVLLHRRHEMFFVPMQYWAILPLLGIVVVLLPLFTQAGGLSKN